VFLGETKTIFFQPHQWLESGELQIMHRLFLVKALGQTTPLTKKNEKPACRPFMGGLGIKPHLLGPTTPGFIQFFFKKTNFFINTFFMFFCKIISKFMF
jgi:hypothetical protein